MPDLEKQIITQTYISSTTQKEINKASGTNKSNKYSKVKLGNHVKKFKKKSIKFSKKTKFT